MGTNQISPAQQLQTDITSTRTDFSRVSANARLTSVSSDFSSLDNAISNLPLRLQKARDRKYAFNKRFESQAQEFQKQWSLTRGQVMSRITSETNLLQRDLRFLESRVSSLNTVTSNSGSVKALRSEISAFDSKIKASERTIKGLFSNLENQVRQIESQLDTIEKSLEWFETASFTLLATEGIVRAVKAVWTRDGKEDKDDPEGYLFLTDQRLLFEQRQEIATKKVLFVTTERKKVQELLFDVPVFSITNIEASKRGMLKNEDWISLNFESGAFAANAQLHLDGQDSTEWQRLINQVKARELDDDRAFEIDQEALDKVKAAPVICPHCGGSLSAPVLRGMDSIKCQFCGNLIKL